MRFLADAGISPKPVEFLRRGGHDAVHVRELAMQRAADRLLAETARAQDRILLTFDLDFGSDSRARGRRSPEHGDQLVPDHLSASARPSPRVRSAAFFALPISGIALPNVGILKARAYGW